MPQHSLDCTHQNVLLPTSCYLVPSYWKRGLSVIFPMWYDLHVSSDSKSSESKRSICMDFLHAYILMDMVRMSQSFQKWVSPKIHQHGATSCVLYQHDSNGSATSMWYYRYQLYIFCYSHIFIVWMPKGVKLITIVPHTCGTAALVTLCIHQ